MTKEQKEKKGIGEEAGRTGRCGLWRKQECWDMGLFVKEAIFEMEFLAQTAHLVFFISSLDC